MRPGSLDHNALGEVMDLSYLAAGASDAVHFVSFGLIDNPVSFSIHKAPWIVTIAFVAGLAASHWWVPREAAARERWLARIDVAWVFSSVIAFSIFASGLATEPARALATQWRFDVRQRQSDLLGAVADLRASHCPPADVRQGPPICGDLRYITAVSAELWRVSRYKSFAENMPLYSLSVVERRYDLKEYRGWGIVQGHMVASNAGVRGYNDRREHVWLAEIVDYLRVLWLWVFPLMGGFRMLKSLDALFPTKMPAHGGRKP